MSSAFPLPLKVDNQTIWQKYSLKFYTIYPRVVAIYYRFISNRYTNTSNCSTNKVKAIIYIKVPFFQLLHLQIFVNIAVVQNQSSITLVCDGDVDK